jgi:hypothetical protein
LAHLRAESNGAVHFIQRADLTVWRESHPEGWLTQSTVSQRLPLDKGHSTAHRQSSMIWTEGIRGDVSSSNQNAVPFRVVAHQNRSMTTCDARAPLKPDAQNRGVPMWCSAFIKSVLSCSVIGATRRRRHPRGI